MDNITISKVSIDGSSEDWHIITQWEEDLEICLVCKANYWKGMFYSRDFEHFYDNLGISKDKYKTCLKDALSTDSTESKYFFKFHNHTLQWKIASNNDLWLVYGKCELNEHHDEGGNELLIAKLLNLSKHNNDMRRHQENETLELGRQLRMVMDRYEEIAKTNSERDNDLYGQVLHLLNAKKQRISDLQQLFFQEVQPETSSHHQSDSPKIKLLDPHPISDSDTD